MRHGPAEQLAAAEEHRDSNRSQAERSTAARAEVDIPPPRGPVITRTTVRNPLTRSSGFLAGIVSHSLQPYRGCTFGQALCGVGCYVRHNGHVLQGRSWGAFLEVRENTAEAYAENHAREAAWARRRGGEFSIFCSSATDPFLPQERVCRVTARLLETMCALPADLLVLQTHSPTVADARDVLRELATRCRLRTQVSIESDQDRLPGLPPPSASVERRIEACARLRDAGLFVVVTVAPLLPIADPRRFFQRISEVADAVVIDHFIGGDGSPDGRRTRRTPLPEAMARIDPESTTLAYRERMVLEARRALPGRVGVHRDGFAGIYA